MNWEVGNGTLTSVTGWAGYEYFDDVDVDWLPLQFIDRSDIHDFEQISQEFAGPQTSGIVFTTRSAPTTMRTNWIWKARWSLIPISTDCFPSLPPVAYGAPIPNLC